MPKKNNLKTETTNKRKKTQKLEFELPLVALRGLVVYPDTLITFDVGRDKSILAIEDALKNEGPVFLVSQRNPLTEEPSISDLFTVGLITDIKQSIKPAQDVLRVFAEGTNRAIIKEIVAEKPFYKVKIEIVKTIPCDFDDSEVQAKVRIAKELFEQFSMLNSRISPDTMLEASSIKDISFLSDFIAIHLHATYEEKQDILEEFDDLKRLEKVITMLYKEIEILGIQRDVYTKVRSSVDKNQKEYLLKEQLKVIEQELNGKDDTKSDIALIKERLQKEEFPDFVVNKINEEIRRLERTPSGSAETNVIRDYLGWLLDLPWLKKSSDNKSLVKAEGVLDKDHYGLKDVKERIIEYLAVKINTNSLDAPILCLVGPPGVGKTSIAKSIAKSLNRKYVRMSLGGVRDEAEIRGHRKTYVGAMPGRIVYSLKQAQTNNPLILLDEIDKIGSDFRGNPAFALLETLDAEQNFSFRDNYIELPFDLSDVLFMCTANSIESIPDALRDRLEIINLSSYTIDEKVKIAMDYLVEKQAKKHGLTKNTFRIKEDTINDIILYYTKEAGVRQLERLVAKLCRKAVKELAYDSKIKSVTFKPDNLEKYLGKRRFRKEEKKEFSEVGVATGLAWTSYGGTTLDIEVNTMSGTGKLTLTGNMGDVMKESAKAAISFIRSERCFVKMPENFYKNTDIHIHIPEGATPKDGPSAGITMATAMISALSDTPVKNDVCMTGEITIRGRVLPIGGLKEKVLAAKSAGLKTVIIPKDNESDLQELSQQIKDDLDFVLVKNMEEVLENALNGLSRG